MSDIDWSQPRKETYFWWRHKGLVTSQSTDLIKCPFYTQHLNETNEHIDTCDKKFMIPRCRRSADVQLSLKYFIMKGWHISFCTTNNRPLLRHNRDTCNYAPLPYLDEDGETNGDTRVSRSLRLNTLYIVDRDKQSVRGAGKYIISGRIPHSEYKLTCYMSTFSVTIITSMEGGSCFHVVWTRIPHKGWPETTRWTTGGPASGFRNPIDGLYVP